MRTILYTTLALRPSPAISGSTASQGTRQVAQFPQSAFPAVPPSASDRAPGATYVQMAEFPRSAWPTRASTGVPDVAPSTQMIARALPHAVPHARVVASNPNG